MRSSKKVFLFGCLATLSFALTAKVHAVIDDNSKCSSAGGCWVACTSSGGSSSNTLGASQTSECSPSQMSSCDGNNQVVCGVSYSYSSTNCDPTTITGSHPSYSYTCGK
jgi:hypothetical protein